jgi:hypothetical protein
MTAPIRRPARPSHPELPTTRTMLNGSVVWAVGGDLPVTARSRILEAGDLRTAVTRSPSGFQMTGHGPVCWGGAGTCHAVASRPGVPTATCKLGGS